MNVSQFNKDVKKITSDSNLYMILRFKGNDILFIDENDHDDIFAETMINQRGTAIITAFDSLTIWADDYEILKRDPTYPIEEKSTNEELGILGE